MRGLITLPGLLVFLIAAELPGEVPLPSENPRQVHQAPGTASSTGAQDDASEVEADEAPTADADQETAPADQKAVTVEEVPLPEKRPEQPEKETAEDDETLQPSHAERSEDESGDEDEEVVEIDPAPLPTSEADLAKCESEMRALGAKFERLDTIDGDGICGVAPPYRLTEAAPGVAVTPDTEMSCRAALATAKWVDKVAIPSAEALGDGVKLTQITHASTYVCRNRNSQADTKISEHAKGNAIDVSRFDFEGHDPVAIVPRAGKGTIEEAFQTAVRHGACLFFTTVLGPGTDSYHSDHLHFDVIERSSGYRLCQ